MTGVWPTAAQHQSHCLKEHGQQWGPPERGAKRTEQCPPTSPKETFQVFERKDKTGSGDGRPNSKPPGMNDPYGIDIAPLNIFENQVIPVGVHNLSKSFKPNMATIRVLSLGTKFIPKWRDANLNFQEIRILQQKNAKQHVFLETSPGTFQLNKQFHLKTHFVSKETNI